MDDLLPIKFFSKREKDAQRVEGGGSKELPKWTLTLEEAKIRVDLLNKNLNQIESEVKEKKIDFIPTIIKTVISEDAKAKTHRREIRKIFSTSEDNLLGTPSKDEILVKINSINDLKKIKENVNNIEKNLYGISCIEEITTFEPNVEISDTCKIRLIDYENYELNIAINNLFEKILKKNKLEYKRTNYTDKLIIFKVNKVDKAVLDKFNEEGILNSIFSIEPMPKYNVSLDELSIEEDIAVKLPKNDEKSIRRRNSGGIEKARLKPQQAFEQGSVLNLLPETIFGRAFFKLEEAGNRRFHPFRQLQKRKRSDVHQNALETSS